jgi:uncharacterized protein with NAD-binding domain and iron-sulfur cluster
MSQRGRIIILGGGVGALTTAYYLTTRPNWEQEYDIIVYQLGWRLGGKCASSRNADEHDRIEEHGLHVWFGFYENAFALMRAVYTALGRPAGSPFAKIDDAFQHRDFVPMMEEVGGQWTVWPLDFPPLPGDPGTQNTVPLPWEVFVALLERVAAAAEEWLGEVTPDDQRAVSRFTRLLHRADRSLRRAALHAAIRFAKSLDSDTALHNKDHDHPYIVGLLRMFRAWFDEELQQAEKKETKHRRAWLMVDLGTSAAIGILEDELFYKGLAAVDDEDFRSWLARHGAKPDTTNSTPVRALYDCCFAYEDGDINRPNFAAGVALGCALHIGLMYRGHVLFEMRAGMGEAVIAPLYEVLRNRGVKFEFFQRVTGLELDGDRVARIRMSRQVHLKTSAYCPLVSVRGSPDWTQGLPCWPATPRYEQIEEGAELERQRINVEEWTLEVAGEDKVVLGISLGGLAGICDALRERSGDWQNLIERLPSAQTQAMQLWMTLDLKGLGWTDASPAMVAAPEPHDVWADMSHLLAQEPWPAGNPPRSVHYLCGPMPGDLSRRPPGEHSVPAEALADARAQAKAWLQAYAGWIWPKAAVPGTEALDWNVLYAPDNVNGEARLDAQWLRANIDPSERYVLSPAKLNRFRLPASQSGFTNLVLAGDWTQTAINAGCVEAAVMSGMEASRALCGYPEKIPGEHFLQG